jgi:hypothetical protein
VASLWLTESQKIPKISPPDPLQIDTNTEGKFGYTYPNPIQLKKEQNKIYLFWRGGNFKPSFAVSNDTINWSPAKTLIEGKGARPYIKFASDGNEKIHFAFTDGHPRNETKNSIYYACYYDGALHKADGTVIRDGYGISQSTILEIL